MKPSELYALPPSFVTGSMHHRLRHNVREVEFDRLKDEAMPRIELRFYADISFDGERGWDLFVVAFDAVPIMVCQQAGRGNQDFYEEFVTDKDRYKQMVKYLESHYEPANDPIQAVDPDADIPELTAFYNHRLEEFYDHNLKPQWKVGDTVMANVPRNHLADQNWVGGTGNKVLARVKITHVDRYNPSETYRGTQVDRKWAEGPISRTKDPITVPNEGSLGCGLTDADIQCRAPAKCRVTRCDSPDAICLHTQTREFYCIQCAVKINRANPEVQNLITLPR